jgi:hypothetical protein
MPPARLGVVATSFHDFPDGETIVVMAQPVPNPPLTDVERGFIAGILVGEGHFGGDGKYPHITLRMHVRHEALFRWLAGRLPRSRLYGPYNHGGRRYFQWMARGDALAEDVLPVVESVLTADMDDHVLSRIAEMRSHYADFFARYD